MKKSIGRPKEKENRVKIGLSLDGQYNDMLVELSKQTGKTKSRLVEEAISDLYERQQNLSRLIKQLNNQQDNSFDTLRTMVRNKL